MTGLKVDQGDRRTTVTDKHKTHVREPGRKRDKVPVRQGDKRRLPLSANHSNYSRKIFRKAEASISEIDIGRYNLRPRIKEAAESRPSRGQTQDQGGPDHPEKEGTRNPDPTTKSTDVSNSLHARVVRSRSRNRSPGVDDQAVRVQEEAEEPNCKSPRKWEKNQLAEGRHRWKFSSKTSATRRNINQVVSFHYIFLTDRQSGELLQQASQMFIKIFM
ncbi:hypothetical protein TNCV_1338241 [Trichonephila clavipes]|nr:hypothetical protein TNCV_1338241 [Trichonephila clavipes]